MKKENINVKDKENKISGLKLLLNMLWNQEEDSKEVWEAEPNRKILEETMEKVDKMVPTIEPTAIKKEKTRSMKKLAKNGEKDSVEKKQSQEIKKTYKDKNKDTIDSEIEL